ncbi:MAG TPA: prephenate dehydrogenase/arogenate dehydrogenase family protein [Ignavibacteriaceae bacterium]
MTTISIIGLGLIGGSFAKALKNSKQDFKITGFDKDDISNKALELKIIDKKINSVSDSLDSDIIILSLPTNLSLEYFKILAPKLRERQIISDVSGVKGVFENEWQKIKSPGFYIGGHPMTGKEKGGLENSDPLLFENSLYLLSEKSKNLPCIAQFTEIIKILGSRIRFIDPHLHDKIIAYVSHLPQVVAVSLVNSLADSQEINYPDFAAGGFRDLTRIASSDFEMWEPVFNYNKNEIISAIESLITKLESMKNFIDKEDANALKDEFSSSKKKRETIPSNIKGFINPVFDIFIYADDKPGILFKLTEVLYKNSINIKDIELLKIREGTGGTFRVSFDTSEAADTAKILLIAAGFRLA